MPFGSLSAWPAGIGWTAPERPNLSAVTRIIAGSRKGRRLRTPTYEGTRPTTDRVREAVFSAIADWAGTSGEAVEVQLDGIALLDLYAGSAAVALEAASRGAQPTYAVEVEPKVAAVARDNCAALGLSTVVVTAAVESWLRADRRMSFDVVWADPPYPLLNVECEQMMELLVQRGWLKPDGLLVLERASRDDPPQFPATMTQRWSRRYGETLVYFAMKD